jgi:protein-arginine deiminase
MISDDKTTMPRLPRGGGWLGLACLLAPGLATRAAEPMPLRLAAEAGRDPVCLVANCDDDDRDGRPDAADDRVNGPADLADLAAVMIEAGDRRIADVRLACETDEIAWFRRDGETWQKLAGDEPVPLVDGRADLLIECRTWAAADPAWDGRATLTAIGLDDAGEELARAEIAVTVAAVELVPETAGVREVYIARGRYENDRFIARLREVLGRLELPLIVHEAGVWQEMWMQDTMELGATAVPGRPAAAMTVVLAGLRGHDPFPETLLGPDVAVARIAEPRPLAGGDAWADWYGNLTVSPPKPAWPRGRVIAGRNTETGEGFHPRVLRFLAAQGVQSPVWIDTSWLLIKHVDEIVAFLPGPDGRGMMLVADPREGLELARAAGLAAATGPRAEVVAEANRRIAAAIDEMLGGGGERPRAGELARDAAGGGEPGDDRARRGLLALLGWEADRVVRLPVAFAAPPGPLPAAGLSDAEALWSNPVNMLFVNGTVVCGNAEMPEAVAAICRRRFLAAGAEQVIFLDDACYHRAKGNVHCGTNTRRQHSPSEPEPVRTAPGAPRAR